MVVANDPDADRLAAAERTADGGYASFSGNDIGLLLADWWVSIADSWVAGSALCAACLYHRFPSPFTNAVD